jgi:hypothetical protein
MMSAPEHLSLNLDEYIRQVEQACSDLSPQVRHRLLADLEVHLRDQASGADLVATLGSPAEYARELRSAMGLPETLPAPSSGQRRRWLLPALIAGVALAVVLGLVGVILAATSNPHTSHGPAASASPTAIPSSAPAMVVVPDVLGKTKTEATAQLEAVGLRVEVETIKDTAALVGLIVAQMPAASSHVVAGSSVTLRIATR